MALEECYDKIRISLNDESGTIRFEDFDIVDAPDCKLIAEVLRKYLVNKPLDAIDVGVIRKLRCRGNHKCMDAIVEVILRYQAMFSCSSK